MSKLDIYPKGYYSNSKCPKCGQDFRSFGCTKSYDSSDETMEYRCIGCSFEWKESIDEAMEQVPLKQKKVTQDSDKKDVEKLTKRCDKLELDLKELKAVVLNFEKRFSKEMVNKNDSVSLDNLDNFKI